LAMARNPSTTISVAGGGPQHVRLGAKRVPWANSQGSSLKAQTLEGSRLKLKVKLECP
jgi:hypothetical protein